MSSLSYGGDADTLALAFVRPSGAENDIQFEAKDYGTGFNGIRIDLIDDGTLPRRIDDDSLPEDERIVIVEASYDSGARVLTINVQNQFTDAQAIIDEINNGDNRFDMPFTASNDGESTGVGGVTAFEAATTSEGVSDTARAVVTPRGANNDLIFTAKGPGTQYGNVAIGFIDSGSIADGTASAVYSTENKTLTIDIQNGITTAAAVISAVNTGANSAAIPFTASNAADNDGTGTIHTRPSPPTGEGMPFLRDSRCLLQVWITILC